MKWERKFDGGLYEGVRPDGLVASIVKMGVGQKGWTVNGTHYSVRVGRRLVGVCRYLADAKRLGETEVPRA